MLTIHSGDFASSSITSKHLRGCLASIQFCWHTDGFGARVSQQFHRFLLLLLLFTIYFIMCWCRFAETADILFSNWQLVGMRSRVGSQMSCCSICAKWWTEKMSEGRRESNADCFAIRRNQFQRRRYKMRMVEKSTNWWPEVKRGKISRIL